MFNTAVIHPKVRSSVAQTKRTANSISSLVKEPVSVFSLNDGFLGQAILDVITVAPIKLTLDFIPSPNLTRIFMDYQK